MSTPTTHETQIVLDTEVPLVLGGNALRIYSGLDPAL